MMLLSGLHRHEMMVNASIDCADCTHHVHHSGHLTADANHMYDCVLCQFLSLVYTPATSMLVIIPFCLIILSTPSNADMVCCEAGQYKSTRAPPFIL